MREHNRPSTVYSSTRSLMHNVGWKGRRIGSIKWREIAETLEGIKARGAPVHANRIFEVLKRLFNFAVEHELVQANSCERKSKPSKEVSRDRVLSDAELRAIWLACTEYPYGPLVRMLMLAGQRRDEVASAVWDEFDTLSASVWHLPAKRTKNRRAHDVPMSSQVVELVGSLPRVSEHLLIHTSAASLSRGKEKLDASCGVEAWTIHDLRRTFCSGLARLGVPIHVIEKCVNHVSGMAGIYNRYSYEAEKCEAMQLWGDHIASLVNSWAAPNAALRCLASTRKNLADRRKHF